jgi:hypothetical protein
MTSTPLSIQEQLQSLAPSAIIELFQIELTEELNGTDETFSMQVQMTCIQTLFFKVIPTLLFPVKLRDSVLPQKVFYLAPLFM